MQIMMDFDTLFTYNWPTVHERYDSLMKQLQKHFQMDEYDVCSMKLVTPFNYENDIFIKMIFPLHYSSIKLVNL